MRDELMDGPDLPDERWELIGRWLAGEATPDEARDLERWLAEDPARATVVARLQAALAVGGFEPAGGAGAPDSAAAREVTDLDVEAALALVHERMDREHVRPIASARSAGRRASPGARGWLWRSTPLRAAAALALLLGGQAIYRALRPEAAPPASAALAFETAAGQADTVTLGDGSIVVLGPASALEVAPGYGQHNRTVTLRGLAWFQVRHGDPAFTVRADDALVTDLGTAFTVRADSAQPVQVTVTDGRVRLAANAGADPGVILEAGQSGAVEAGTARTAAADAAAATAWLDGRLVFRDAAFPQVAAELHRWYGVRLVAGDATVAERRLTSEFQGEPLESVLAVIALALDARAETRGDTVALHAR